MNATTRKARSSRPIASAAQPAGQPAIGKPAKNLVRTTLAKPATVQRTTPAKKIATPSVVKGKARIAPENAPPEADTVKAKKAKLVRDSFTIPKVEYAVLDELKTRAGRLDSAAKKSELIRAGIMALASMSDSAFLAAVKAVPTIKTGRPKA